MQSACSAAEDSDGEQVAWGLGNWHARVAKKALMKTFFNQRVRLRYVSHECRCALCSQVAAGFLPLQG